MHRLVPALVAIVVAGCTCDSPESDASTTDWGAPTDRGVDWGAPTDRGVDGGEVVPGPDGAFGVCCPVGAPSCSCTPNGGWAPSIERCECEWDVRSWSSGTDEWGCPILISGIESCLDPPPVYEACTPVRGCSSASDFCLTDEWIGDLGGPDDPIRSHPDGEDTIVERTLFPDGTCTASFPGGTAECDPAEPAEVCGAEGTCVELELGRVCLQACADSAECRDGYRCDPDLGGCIGACRSDDECRISREETNGIGGLQPAFLCTANPGACTPADCGEAEPADPDACADPESNFDRLVYDTESAAVCDPETLRCME